MFPDSGADISAAGEQPLHLLSDYDHSLLPQIFGRLNMFPLGYLPITFTVGGRQHTDIVHIHPKIPGTILSWKAAKALTILLEYYTQPILLFMTPKHPPKLNIQSCYIPHLYHTPIQHIYWQRSFQQYDEHIRTTEGAKFTYITLMVDIPPFCFKTPRSIPFAYHDKLKTELDCSSCRISLHQLQNPQNGALL